MSKAVAVPSWSYRPPNSTKPPKLPVILPTYRSLLVEPRRNPDYSAERLVVGAFIRVTVRGQSTVPRHLPRTSTRTTARCSATLRKTIDPARPKSFQQRQYVPQPDLRRPGNLFPGPPNHAIRLFGGPTIEVRNYLEFRRAEIAAPPGNQSLEVQHPHTRATIKINVLIYRLCSIRIGRPNPPPNGICKNRHRPTQHKCSPRSPFRHAEPPEKAQKMPT